MNNEVALDLVWGVLGNIAPEADRAKVDTGAALHDVLDLDSLDFLNFVSALHERAHVDIPERDYPLVSTIDGCVSYLASRSSDR